MINTSAVTPPVAPINPWRVPKPTLSAGKYGSVIVDRGQLKKSVVSSNNYHLFSETGTGAQSLVIVGTALQIFDFLLSHQHQGIENRITSLPDIYMGISPYTPKARFTGVFGIGDTMVQVVSYFAGAIPVPAWVSIATAPTTLDAMKKSLAGLKETEKQKGDLLYVKFSYLPEDKMQKIASRKVSFKDVLQIFQKNYK
ncbi:hypothetical protein [Pseudomonas huanghezhanensis]|uniref:hypothetical protein n=1 Tax=Pseudomonas huanghezhanensis TaxID=3002903 RepID=UPI002285E259|nr:hypothetical protein [Pseudomonas sp. BSw22131]